MGANDVIRGVTRNPVALETLPPVNVSVIRPEVAPLGTVVRSAVGGSSVKLDTLTPLKKWTSLTAGRLAPLIVTGVPTGPAAGVNDVTATRKAVRATATRALLLVLPSGTR